jgi:hypothetical protein
MAQGEVVHSPALDTFLQLVSFNESNDLGWVNLNQTTGKPSICALFIRFSTVFMRLYTSGQCILIELEETSTVNIVPFRMRQGPIVS